MDVLKRIFFSTTTMGILLLIFLSSIGIATFIENGDSTEAAKISVYNAFWFELVLMWLTANLIFNTIRYRMWRWSKVTVLTFHLSFVVIILGAGISRYTGEEGIIKVAENEAVNYMFSAEPYLNITGINLDGTQNSVEMQKWFAVSTPSSNDFQLNFPTTDGSSLVFDYVAFIPNAIDTIKQAEKGGMEILELMVDGKIHFLADKGMIALREDLFVSFNNDTKSSAIQITSYMGDLFVTSPYDGLYKNMESLTVEDRSNAGGIVMDSLSRDEKHPFNVRTLYNFDGAQIVMKKFHDGVNLSLKSAGSKGEGIDALVMNAVNGETTRQIVLKGGKGRPGIPFPFMINGMQYMAKYGSKIIPLPFQIGLKDFRLLNYPGSNSPSSFESDIVLEDTINGVTISQTILMNHVMDYRGYRIFQSSYDSSLPSGESNITLLSVNVDFWGTWVTYTGYLLMALGFVFTLMFKTSRFRELSRTLKKIRKQKAALTLLFLLGSSIAFSQDPNYTPVPITHAEQASKICVQDMKGRIKPLHTLATEVMRKISKRDNYEDQNAVQVFLGMTFRPDHWQEVPLIWVRNNEIRKKIGISGSYASFTDFTYIDGDEVKIKLEVDQATAFNTPESGRNAYQKEVIKTFDKLILLTGIFNKQGLKIFPVLGDDNLTWSSGTEPVISSIPTSIDSLSALQLLVAYEVVLNKGWNEGDWTGAERLVKQVGEYQLAVAGDIIPSAYRIDMEIAYNEAGTLDKIYHYYLSAGVLILVFELFFILLVFKSAKVNTALRKISKIVGYFFIGIVLLLALWQGYTLGIRWYISGHAPWSTGYEALSFIGFMCVIAGLIFAKGSKLTLGVSILLGGILLMTAHHSNYDPDIGNLVPVLKSYWLMIHVAVITSSYAFLGLGAMLGFISLLLHIFRFKANFKTVTLSIAEITFVSEMAITIGLIMAAVGTFLGGVWANESWGRYWGWDSKETWALVIVLTYALILHFRFIPGMKSKLLFNSVSVIAFASVLMTFFGVNFYLSGLHSYAQGDAPPFPMWATITITMVGLIIALAVFRNSRTKQPIDQ
ncbi:MAG: cytochrome c biogenesis protein CcsA [Flavobacteriales bacterium]|nr:cytochrome c biogenesis protein CcsA [Flavobacteriales bacterium]